MTLIFVFCVLTYKNSIQSLPLCNFTSRMKTPSLPMHSLSKKLFSDHSYCLHIFLHPFPLYKFVSKEASRRPHIFFTEKLCAASALASSLKSGPPLLLHTVSQKKCSMRTHNTNHSSIYKKHLYLELSFGYPESISCHRPVVSQLGV